VWQFCLQKCDGQANWASLLPSWLIWLLTVELAERFVWLYRHLERYSNVWRFCFRLFGITKWLVSAAVNNFTYCMLLHNILFQLTLSLGICILIAFLSEFRWVRERKNQLLLFWSQGYRDWFIKIDDFRWILEIAASVGRTAEKEENRKGVFMVQSTLVRTILAWERFAGYTDGIGAGGGLAVAAAITPAAHRLTCPPSAPIRPQINSKFNPVSVVGPPLPVPDRIGLSARVQPTATGETPKLYFHAHLIRCVVWRLRFY
jgi:hypothetical protein